MTLVQTARRLWIWHHSFKVNINSVFIKYLQLKFYSALQLTEITPTISVSLDVQLNCDPEKILLTTNSTVTSFPFPFWEVPFENSFFFIIKLNHPTHPSLTSCPSHQTDEFWRRRWTHHSPCDPSRRWRRWTCCPPQGCCSAMSWRSNRSAPPISGPFSPPKPGHVFSTNVKSG